MNDYKEGSNTLLVTKKSILDFLNISISVLLIQVVIIRMILLYLDTSDISFLLGLRMTNGLRLILMMTGCMLTI